LIFILINTLVFISTEVLTFAFVILGLPVLPSSSRYKELVTLVVASGKY